jgi:probable HAF family extracellular repeat protein
LGFAVPSLVEAQSRTIIDLGTLFGYDTEATGINAAGQVVGFSYLGNFTAATHAFLYTPATQLQPGTLKDLETLGGSVSSALGINDSGQVVGFSNLSDSCGVLPSLNSCYHAFLYTPATQSQPATMKDLGTLGGSFSAAAAINDSGQVVSYSVTSNGATHAFFYSGATMMDLGTLGGPESRAYGINAAGQIVGESYTSANTEHAFLYTPATQSQAATMTDLGTLGGPGSYA